MPVSDRENDALVGEFRQEVDHTCESDRVRDGPAIEDRQASRPVLDMDVSKSVHGVGNQGVLRKVIGQCLSQRLKRRWQGLALAVDEVMDRSHPAPREGPTLTWQTE